MDKEADERMNTAAKGRRLEEQIVNYAIEHGAIFAGRFAASKNKGESKVDVLIIKDQFVYLIQAKNQHLSNNAKLKLYKELEKAIKPNYYFIESKVLADDWKSEIDEKLGLGELDG